MNKTASKLAASVQRAKTQPSAAPQDGEKAVPAATPSAPSADDAQARPARAPRAKPAVEAPAETPAVTSEDHHNGGQPTFPGRVWPD